jgi:NDP-sugar pyrophosphorylase family protein
MNSPETRALLAGMTVIIPAAGAPRNRWLANYREPVPDCLIPVGGRPALFWTLQELAELQAAEVILVVAEGGGEIERFAIQTFGKKLRIRVVLGDPLLSVGDSVVRAC